MISEWRERERKSREEGEMRRDKQERRESEKKG
jgi:hypothetical protein